MNKKGAETLERKGWKNDKRADTELQGDDR